jgi:hypothetical protein
MDNRHTIQRQVLEVTTADPSAKMGFERALRDLYLDTLLPRIESLFDSYGPAGTSIRAEKLEIRVTLPHTGNWEESLCEAVLRELEQALRGAIRTGETDAAGFVHTPPGDEADILFHFLSTGTFPWYAERRTMEELRAYIGRVSQGEIPVWGSPYDPGSFLGRVVRLLAASDTSLARWLSQLGEGLLAGLLSHTPEYKTAETWAARLPVIAGEDLRRPRWRILLSFLCVAPGPGSSGDLPPSRERDMFRAFLQAVPREKMTGLLGKEQAVPTEIHLLLSDAREIPETREARHQKGRNPFGEGAYIDNAGLVLLHPFLAPLFTVLEYWDGAGFRSVAHHQRAVLLSQYMVCPGEDFPEHQLLLNKILCGYGAEETLEPLLDSTDRERGETDELLQSVIRHWTMNGRAVFTTVENLRASFLRRPGKLTRRNDDWLLQVEGAGYDIVMKSLPWGIGIVKHPWMPDRLRVEWV